MFKRLVLSLLLAQFLIGQAVDPDSKDIYLYIDNFDASDPNTVTFDIMMDNRSEVFGVQFDLMSGNGEYDGTDACLCDLDDNGSVPANCGECYFDNGLDRIRSAYEIGYVSSADGCVDIEGDSASGICSDQLYSSASSCEEYGECNNGKTSLDYDCFIFGFADEANYPTCTVSDVSEIGVLDDDSLIAACATEDQACDDVGIDDFDQICNLATFDNGVYDAQTQQYEYCVDDESEATNCCVDAGAVFTNWGEDRCEETYGECDGEASASECGCIWDGDSWVGSGYTWYPYNLWTPYGLPAICQENTDFNGNNYNWEYANPDPGGDDYRIYAPDNTSTHGDLDGNYQYCIVPGVQDGDDYVIPGTIESYDEYIGNGPDGAEAYNMAGHCSITEGYCVGTGDSGTGNGQILNWSSGCCTSTAGAVWINPSRDYEKCTQTSLDSGQIIPTQGSWTAYSTPDLCRENDGFWIGSTDGEEKNELYDNAGVENEPGENFVDANAQLDVTAISNDDLPVVVQASLGTNNALGSGLGDRIFMFSLTNDVIFPITEYCSGATAWNDDTNICSGSEALNEVDCCNLTGTWTEGPSNLVVSVTADKNVTAGSIATIMSKNICSDDEDSNCPVSALFSDLDASPISVYFDPYIWDVSDNTDGAGYSLSDAASDGDNICSRYAGETSASSSDCEVICGDGICNGSEDFGLCQSDCSAAAGALDDGFCNLYAGETFENSIDDCAETGCGDYVCNSTSSFGAETSESCSEDCLTICGNSSCDTGENETNCPSDCSASCGNDACEYNLGENFVSCAQDCSTSICGDGYYHHIGLGGTEDGSCEDYQLVCGDGVYHYEGIIGSVQVGGEYEVEEDENCDDYVISDGDEYYHYLGLTSPNGILATSVNAEDNSSADYIQTYGDNVCDCSLTEGLCGDSSGSESPGNEPACPSICGDGYYHHIGASNQYCVDDNCEGTETDINCPEDYAPKPNDGICDGSSGSGESPVNGNGESVAVEPACLAVCGDGYCDVTTGETSGNCALDCTAAENGVCARWTLIDGVDADGVLDTGLENAYNSADCTYNNTDFDLCGNGICDNGNVPDLGEIGTPGYGIGTVSLDVAAANSYTGYGFTYNWGETAGDVVGEGTNAGTCDLDCAITSDCTFGENISENSWYNYDDCYECSDSFDDGDGCQEGYGETADPTHPDFCYYDCWTGCGDGVCDGTLTFAGLSVETKYNCLADAVEYQYPDDQLGQITILPTSTGDCLDVENEIPKAYSLSDNYPNPFNPATTIHYSVQNAGNVKIDIYNVLGQHVYTLVDEYCIPGVMYQVVWDSSVDSKTPLSSGVYFYQMISGNFEQEGMMTIIK